MYNRAAGLHLTGLKMKKLFNVLWRVGYEMSETQSRCINGDLSLQCEKVCCAVTTWLDERNREVWVMNNDEHEEKLVTLPSLCGDTNEGSYARFQPFTLNHLRHLGSAIVREFEVRTAGRASGRRLRLCGRAGQCGHHTGHGRL